MRNASAKAMNEHRSPRPKNSHDLKSAIPSGVVRSRISTSRPASDTSDPATLAVMREHQVETECQRQVTDKRDQPEQLAKIIAVIELPYPRRRRSGSSPPDVEQGEREGFHGPTPGTPSSPSLSPRRSR